MVKGTQIFKEEKNNANKRFNKQVPGFGFKAGGRAMKKVAEMISGTAEKTKRLVFIVLIWE